MTARKKVLRNIVTVVCVYIILNVLIYGIMTAYMNTRNILSEDKLTMAEISGNGEQTSIKILGREYSANISEQTLGTVTAVLYCAANEKIRACAELLTQAREYFFDQM